MEPIQISVTGNTVSLASAGAVIAGTVGLSVEFTFDAAWEFLEKTAVFRANGKTIDQIHLEKTATVPWELLQNPGCHLWVGVYGSNADGSLQIPTSWADLGVIQPGADPSGDESADPALPVWQQLTQDVENTLQEIIRHQERILSGSYVPQPTEAGDA